MVNTKPEIEHRMLPLLEPLAGVGRRADEASMLPGGIRTRHLIALKLLCDQGPANQQDLADALSLDPSNVVGLLNELEERELITRRRDRTDRRRHIVELSPLGQDELTRAYTRLSSVEDELLSALSAEEQDTLYTLIVRAVGTHTPPCAAADPPPPPIYICRRSGVTNPTRRRRPA